MAFAWMRPGNACFMMHCVIDGLSIVSICPLEALEVVLDLVASVHLHLEAFTAGAEVV